MLSPCWKAEYGCFKREKLKEGGDKDSQTCESSLYDRSGEFGITTNVSRRKVLLIFFFRYKLLCFTTFSIPLYINTCTVKFCVYFLCLMKINHRICGTVYSLGLLLCDVRAAIHCCVCASLCLFLLVYLFLLDSHPPHPTHPSIHTDTHTHTHTHTHKENAPKKSPLIVK